MLPRVILHNQVSLDGRIDWFTPDVGLYYEIAARWQADAHLAGSNTIFNPDEEIPPEEPAVFEPRVLDPNDRRPLLVVPDSTGKVRNWHVLRQMPYWRDTVALCSHGTPKEYLTYLEKRHIHHIVRGNEQVELRAALEELSAQFGVKKVLVDSGGTLNGVLLRAGLVDEISILISPNLVGGVSPRSMFRAPDLTHAGDVIPLRLMDVETVRGGVVWLRYETGT
jgi:2,5-diamino-6-(ribosylamino)-4(3H)-pyrimidinone 5'-phosphate reductase